MRLVSQGAMAPVSTARSEFAFDQVGELPADEDEVGAEGAAGAGHFNQHDAGECAMADEDIDQAQQSGIETLGGRVNLVHFALDGVDQLIGELAYEGAEDGGFAGEMEVGGALGASGAVNDVIDGGAVVALFAEDVEGGFKEGDAGCVFAAG